MFLNLYEWPGNVFIWNQISMSAIEDEAISSMK